MARSGARAPAFSAFVTWTNQDLVLYHGTIDLHQASILAGVNVTRGRSRTDFGREFYTTTYLKQARNWAQISSLGAPGSQPVVIQFIVSRDDLAALESVWFVRGARDAGDYWSLVNYCRTGGTAHGRAGSQKWYAVTVGPVMKNLKGFDTFRGYDQIAFHSARAEKVLNTSQRLII